MLYYIAAKRQYRRVVEQWEGLSAAPVGGKGMPPFSIRLPRTLHWDFALPDPGGARCTGAQRLPEIQTLGNRAEELHRTLFTNSAGTRRKFFSDKGRDSRIPQGRQDECHSPFGNFIAYIGCMWAREACLMTCCVFFSFFVMCRYIDFL